MQDDFELETETPEEIEMRRRRARRRLELKREKERYLRRMRFLKIGCLAAIAMIAVVILVVKGSNDRKKKEEEMQTFPITVQGSDAYKNLDSEVSVFMKEEGKQNGADESFGGGEASGASEGNDDTTQQEGSQTAASETIPVVNGHIPGQAYTVTESADMKPVNGEVVSSAAVVIDRSSEQIISQRDARARISPASMTKILTVLVAAEHVTDLDDTFTITRDITDYGYVNDCSSAGFLEDETVTIRDLFYGTILPSGADAAVGLATYVAGSQEAFVEMMNEKLSQMGLASTTHMTNCVGIYDEQHYSTALDMALILEAAVDDPLCREVLSAHTYTTSVTEQHPEGIIISNWFLRRIEDKDTHGEVVGAKTGYVVQSGSCAASYAEDKDGNGYICVTAGSTSSWRCIYDHVALYQQFLPSTS